MATARVQQKVGPRLQQKPQVLVPRGPAREAALRLLSAERSEEIFPILLEEIVTLGFPRAAVLEVDYDTGEVRATASLNTSGSVKYYAIRYNAASTTGNEYPSTAGYSDNDPTVTSQIYGVIDQRLGGWCS